MSDDAGADQTHTPARAMPERLSYVPNEHGRFGDFGGQYVPETLLPALAELTEVYERACRDRQFWADLAEINRTYIGRPTALTEAPGLSGEVSRRAQGKDRGAAIWLKREDLAHTGAHKINNTLGQALLARKMGKRRIIAETGAGQHGVATATAAARMGLKCDVYMGAEDTRRQRLNVVRMQMLGANVIPVETGSRTLKDATNEAMRDWLGSVEDTHYIIGSVVGPHPFPMIVRDFQSIIGREAKAQCLRNLGRLPEAVVACVGGGSNAAGIFYPFIDDDEVALHGVEAGGRSSNLGEHAAPLAMGKPGVLHGSLSYVLQNDEGQTAPVHSASAGLDYPGVGPEHSFWKDAGRVQYGVVTDQQALDALLLCSRSDGIIPALETAHAVAYALDLAVEMPSEAAVVVCFSGRGDKDVEEVLRLFDGDLPKHEVRDRGPGRSRRKKKSKEQPKRDTGAED